MEMKKTIFLDIDGVIFKHNGNMSTQIVGEPELLPGVLDVLNDWDRKGYKIILTTGRRESARVVTEKQLQDAGIFYDQLVMGIFRGERVIINDGKPNSDVQTVRAIQLNRNDGLGKLIEDV